MSQDAGRDRRMHARARVAAVATLRGDKIQHYLVRNLSVGGALLSGRGRQQPGTGAQAIFDLISFPDAVRVSLEVLRCEEDVEGNPLLGVAFRGLDPSSRKIIATTVLNELGRDTDSGTLIADRRIPALRVLAQRMHALPDVPVLLASTPLEIVRALHNNPKVRAVIVGRGAGEPWATQILSIIADDFPGVRRILVCSPEEAGYAETFLVSGIADVVLAECFTVGELVDALGNADST